MQTQKRIWELDALRGLCILCVIVVHFLFDLSYFGGLSLSLSPAFLFVQQYGGVVFVLLSGLCATLGSRSLRRGLIVFGCGMGITLVSYLMVRLGMADNSVIVKFGVLHLLGVCMILYPLLRKLSTPALALIGAVLVVIGYYLTGITVEAEWLFPLGLTYPGFTSGDYFPLLPHLGWYMLGIWLGRTLYREKKTLLPGAAQDSPLARFFCFCGRNSLLIYLLHQPVCYGLLELFLWLKR